MRLPSVTATGRWRERGSRQYHPCGKRAPEHGARGCPAGVYSGAGAILSLTLKAGERLGPYEVLGLIGVGGIGEVSCACDLRLGR